MTAARAPRAAIALIAAACGGGQKAAPPAAPDPPPASVAERMLAMLPDGAQVVVEIDLARLRANAVIGAVVARALADDPAAAPGASAAAAPGSRAWLRSLVPRTAGPAGAPDDTGSLLGAADQVVLAAYGVGTADAALVGVLAAPHDIAGVSRLVDGYYAFGPPAWVEQIEQRVALASTGEAKFAIHAAPELLALRARAMPAGAPGASLRVTARLSFDARVAFARLTGLDAAPAQVSAWGDVADDLALVIDCDANDPGSKPSDAPRRLAATLRGMLAASAEIPAVRLLGLPASLAGARLAAHGSWVRTIIAIGPAHLRRVVDRAAGLFGTPAPAVSPSTPPRGDHSS